MKFFPVNGGFGRSSLFGRGHRASSLSNPPDSSKALPAPEVGLTVALHITPRLDLCMPRVCCALETS